MSNDLTVTTDQRVDAGTLWFTSATPPSPAVVRLPLDTSLTPEERYQRRVGAVDAIRVVMGYTGPIAVDMLPAGDA